MAWGILEDKKTPRPLGTVPLGNSGVASALASAEDENLKRKGEIILQPQPSDSPNDPLNWTYTRKVTLFFILIVSSIAVSGIASMLSTGVKLLAVQFHTDFPTVTKVLRPPGLIAATIGLFLSSAIAGVWGKRVQFVLASIMVLVWTLTGYFADSLPYYQGLSAIGGLTAAPLELLIAPVIADMIYVHERGTLVALSAVVGVIGNDASHIISGNIIDRLGIKYTFIISFVVWIPIAILIYFFVYETTFDRTAYRAKQKGQLQNIINEEKVDVIVQKENVTTQDVEVTPSITDKVTEPEQTGRQRLRIFRGRLTDRSFFKGLVQPFPLMLFPGVVFSVIVNGAFGTWVTILGTINLQVLAFPPYDLSPDKLAYITLPGSAVGFVCSVISGLFTDWLIKYMAKKNNGMYEPEYRLLTMIPAVIFSTLGFALIGPAYAEQASVVKIVGLSLLINAASPFAGSASFTYIFDTLQKSSTEAFVATSLFKSMFGFFTLEFVPTWFIEAGPIKVFRTLTILNLAFSALTIPMYIYGKRVRGAVTRNETLMKFTVSD